MGDLINSTLNFISSATTDILVDFFDFDCGFEITDAIEYFKELELYNACGALDKILSTHIQKFALSL